MDGELLADQPLGQKLIKKGFWLYFFAYLTAPAAYLIKVIISNSLSVADVGILYSIVSLITILNIYNDLGLTESLQYFLPRYRIKKQYNYIKTSIYLSLFVQIFTAIIIATFLWFGAPRLAAHYFQSPEAATILRYFCLYFLGINIFQVLQSIFMAFQDTFNYQFTEMLRNRAILGFTFFFFITGQGNVANYSLNRILGLAVGIMIAGIIFRRKYRKHVLQGKIIFEKPMLKEYTKYALRCFLGLNVVMLFLQITQQIVIVMIGPEAAGYYTNFMSLFMISNVILGPVIGLMYPLTSELIAKNDTKKLSMLYDFFYTYFSIAALSLAGLFLALGPEIALIIYGKKFVFSGVLFSRSAIFTVLVILFSFNYNVLAGLGKIKDRVEIFGITTIVNIVLDIILIKYIGIYGAMISLIVSWMLLFILSYRKIIKIHQVQVDWRFMVRNTIIIMILTLSVYLIKNGIFVFDDLMRYRNLGWFLIIFVAFYMIFLGFNYKKLFLFKKELKNLRKIGT